MKQIISNFESLIATIRSLRGDGGCPWDKKQTTESLKKYLLEEFDEIINAMDKHDYNNLCEELGDFLYLIVMLSEINRQEDRFSLEDVIKTIDDKLVRRHPHVFDGKKVSDEETLRKQWLEIKKSEKHDKS